MSLSLATKKSFNRKRKPQSVARAVASAMRSVHPEPPPIMSSMMVRNHTFRFVNLGLVQSGTPPIDLVNYPINPSDIVRLAAMYNQTYGSSGAVIAEVVALFTRIRIKKVTLWALPQPLVGAPYSSAATVALRWLQTGSDSTSSEVTQTDTSRSADRYATVSLRPVPHSPTSQWQSATTTTGGFLIDLPVNGILDLKIDAFISNGDTTNTTTVAGPLNTGFPYGMCNVLDPGTSLTGYLQPAGYASLYNNAQDPTPRA